VSSIDKSFCEIQASAVAKVLGQRAQDFDENPLSHELLKAAVDGLKGRIFAG